jgi:hypothetical protein
MIRACRCCCPGAEGRQLAASIAQRWLLTMFESWSSAGTKFFHKSAFICTNGHYVQCC